MIWGPAHLGWSRMAGDGPDPLAPVPRTGTNLFIYGEAPTEPEAPASPRRNGGPPGEHEAPAREAFGAPGDDVPPPSTTSGSPIRETILAAAEALLAEGGASALTLRRVAARAGCTAPALYRHVGNKTELLRTLGDRILHRLREEASSPHGPGEAPAELEAIARAAVRFGLEHPERSAFLCWLSASDPGWAGTSPVLASHLARLEDAVQVRSASPQLASPAVTYAFASLVHGLAVLARNRPAGSTAGDPAAVDGAVEALLRGFGG